MIAAWLRWRASDALRETVRAVDSAYIGLDVLRQSVTAALWRASNTVDPDRLPCPECHEPGGAHLDCDLPELGRMTATERRQAFGPGGCFR